MILALTFKYNYSNALKGLFLVVCVFINILIYAQPNNQTEIADAEIKKYLDIPTFDSLLKQTDYDREVLVFNDFNKKILPIWLKEFAVLSKKIKQYAIEHHHQNLLIEFECLEVYFNRNSNTKEHLERLFKLKQEAIDNKNEWGAIIFQYLIAENYMNIQEDFPTGFLLLTETLDKIESDKSKKYFIRNTLLYVLELYHYRLGDYSSALNYGRRLTKCSFNCAHITNANMMGIIYRNLNELDSSTYCFKQELEYGLKKKDSQLITMSSGNIGENYYLQKKYAAALPLLNIDAKYHYASGEWGNASNAYLLMASIYIAKSNLSNAEVCLKIAQQCIEIIRNTKQYPTIEKYKRHKLLYEIFTKYYIATSNSHFASLYFDSAKLITDSIANIRGRMTVLKTDGVFKLQKSEILKLKLENDLFEYRIKQFVLVIVFLILTLSSVFGFVKYRVKVKLRHSNLQLEKEKVEEDLVAARAALEQYLKDKLPKEPIGNHINWKLISIVTPEHWKEFKILFDKSYPGYYLRLNEKMNNLTEGETRLMCLLKLNLTDIDMSNILGVNKNSIHQTRGRLKKKINIQTNEHLQELAQSI